MWTIIFCQCTCNTMRSGSTSTVWINSSPFPWLNLWGIPDKLMSKIYAKPWSLPHTTSLPFSANTACLTYFFLAGTLNVSMAEVRFGGYKSKPLTILSIKYRPDTEHIATFPLNNYIFNYCFKMSFRNLHGRRKNLGIHFQSSIYVEEGSAELFC